MSWTARKSIIIFNPHPMLWLGVLGLNISKREGERAGGRRKVGVRELEGRKVGGRKEGLKEEEVEGGREGGREGGMEGGGRYRS